MVKSFEEILKLLTIKTYDFEPDKIIGIYETYIKQNLGRELTGTEKEKIEEYVRARMKSFEKDLI